VIASAALVLGLLATGPDDREPAPSRAAAATAAASVVPGRWQAFARCVERRESNNQPHVVNSSGHAGLYQFSRAWTHSLPYIIARGLKAHGMTARQARSIRISLAGKRIEQYPAIYQRVAFAQVLAEGGRAAAMRHWHLSGSPCNALAAS
jgi:hypothetical protein